MRIDFSKLITDWNVKKNDKLTKAKFARELVAIGFHDSEQSAINMMRNCEQYISKGVTWELLRFLVKRFEVPGSEVIEWDEPTISDVAPSIRDDASGLNKFKT